ncbi:MAG: ATP-grasp domain-containing protein, partial [Thiotrichales bacterium]|nr:ATP-grasp domain-containing protein [Thiotrichales bacterium]
MKLFVCEFITGGGLAGTALPDTLLREGNLMLHAVLTDLLQAGCQDILSTYDQRLEKPDFALACQPASVNVWEQWDALLQQADAALIIAPETAGALYRLCTLAEANHCDLLGCGSECIALTSSKRNTLAVLAEWGIRVPVVYDPDDPQLERSPAVIVKPDTGVGAEHVRKFACGGTLKQWLRAHDAEADWLVQEFIDGTPASMTLLCLADQCRVLAVNHQKIDF